MSFTLFRILLLLFAFAECTTLNAQSMPVGELYADLEKLNKLGSVLYIAAHPDDENTRLLTWLSKDQKLRTAYLSLTRGEGGQNLIGDEKGPMLGLVRTHELLAARKLDGAHQFFTRAIDFGYSKNPEETLQKWNHDSILSDVVRVIRFFKPDVIICRFPTSGEGGHGHHTASAILAMEAFDQAANPGKFPGQVKSLGVWQAKKLFWNTFQFGSNNTTSPNQIRQNVGVYLPLLGRSTGEIAALSRSMHKSQGFGTAPVAGEITEYFKPLKGDSSVKELFAGLNFGWSRIKNYQTIQSLIHECLQTFKPEAPHKSVEILIRIYNEIQELKENSPETSHWKQIKSAEIERLLISVCGLKLEALSDEPVWVSGKQQRINLRMINRSKTPIKVTDVFYPDLDSTLNLSLPYNQTQEIVHLLRNDVQMPLSIPYWLRENSDENMYRFPPVENPLMQESEAPVHVSLKIQISGLVVSVQLPVLYKKTDPVKGETSRNVEILPKASVQFSEPVYFYNKKDTVVVLLTVESHTADFRGRLRLRCPEGMQVTPESIPVNIPLAKQKNSYKFHLISGGNAIPSGEISAEFLSDKGVPENANTIQQANYEHLPPLQLIAPARSKLVWFEHRLRDDKIGFIPGSGDEIPGILKQLGYRVEIVPAASLDTARLSRFSTLITGIRAYNVSEALLLQHAKLMQYVQDGGNLLVQYNTNNRLDPIKSNIGPYPFQISRNRVTDENAEVHFLTPSHPVLNHPYIIQKSDFDGWIQERGIYFAEQCDSAYAKPFGFSDSGEKQLDGSLIVCSFGKGQYIYTGLSFFRQIPAGVPGAMRLFLNLMNPKSPK